MKKELKFKFDLDCKVAIYVPSTVDVDKEVNNEQQVLQIIKKLSLLFGGATASDAVGGWVANDGQTVIEKIKIVYSYCTSEQLKENIDTILEICENLKKEMLQEAITLEINGQVKFI
ncbi:hypothetical protein [Prevotella amnii]|uniref:hypothetical protein n=1 Tax=Prevotella amnii TaxID=419005 RepID=UPI00068A3AF1|nr:hypothetical protein [Prevotella amnii]